MPERSRSQNAGSFTQELQDATTSSPAFDRDLAVKIGKRIAVRRNFCGLSKQQLGARLGIDPVEVEAYEQGATADESIQSAIDVDSTPRTSPVDMWIGSRVRIKRTSRGMSQQEFCKLLDIGSNDLAAFEAGAERLNPRAVATSVRLSLRFFLTSAPYCN
jgi:transcriptional regulator with XRE-family HTH domain